MIVLDFLAGLPTRLMLRRLLALTLVAAGLGWGGVRGVEAWWYRSELDRAGRELASGQYAPARQRLARLAARWPGRDEVEYPLGVCEAALGNVEPALEAWARVPADSGLAADAALGRSRLALEHGRLAVAEESLARVLTRSGAVGEKASRLARQLDLFSGRAYRINRRIEEHWATAPDQAGELRTHWLYDTQPPPMGPIGEYLERFGREAPDDDRVWLGKADIATRAGRLAEADDWLKRCEARRPDDPDVNRARLFWSLEAGRLDVATQVLPRLLAAEFSPAEIASLTARLAALRGDAAAERSALERRVELEPGDAAAWSRLADLAARAGSAGAELLDRARKRRTEIDRAGDQYRTWTGEAGTGNLAHLRDLARTAELLGRRFEARGWWSLLARQAPDDREARAALDQMAHSGTPARRSPSDSGQTLADLLIPAGAIDRRAAESGTAITSDSHARTEASADGLQNVPTFRDDAQAAGLRFVYDNDHTPLCRLPETFAGGLGVLDYDGDGWLDVFVAQGGRFPPTPDAAAPSGDRLFRNRRDGTFEDVSVRAGIASFRRGFGHGVAVADYDNDGRPDILVTRWRSYALYRNKGDGTFQDVTDRAGLGGSRGWPTSAAFADFDGDGDLDLYVCHYLQWDPDHSLPCPDPDRPGKYVYCVPRGFVAEQDHIFRNDGGRFVDVTAASGIVDAEGRGLGVVVVDLDDDGKPDIYVANDMSANYLYHNLGGFRFEEVGEASGAAFSSGGGYLAGMGIACGDFDGDGRPDLAVTNFYGESVSLYQNLGGNLFADCVATAGLAAPTRFVLGFGAYFLDANNDGRIDLAFNNGHVNDFRPAIPYAMPAQLFLGAAGGRFVDASTRAGSCWAERRVGRGLAVGDLDNDGLADVLLLAQNGPVAFLHNLGPGGHFVTLRLEGKASNRDGVGACVRVTTSGRTQTSWRLGGGSFLSASDNRLQFGLGATTRIESIEVRWPSHHVDRYSNLAADTAYLLREGQAQVSPLPGWRQALGLRTPVPFRKSRPLVTADSSSRKGHWYP